MTPVASWALIVLLAVLVALVAWGTRPPAGRSCADLDAVEYVGDGIDVLVAHIDQRWRDVGVELSAAELQQLRAWVLDLADDLDERGPGL